MLRPQDKGVIFIILAIAFGICAIITTITFLNRAVTDNLPECDWTYQVLGELPNEQGYTDLRCIEVKDKTITIELGS